MESKLSMRKKTNLWYDTNKQCKFSSINDFRFLESQRTIEIKKLEKESGNRGGANWRMGLLNFNYGESATCY